MKILVILLVGRFGFAAVGGGAGSWDGIGEFPGGSKPGFPDPGEPEFPEEDKPGFPDVNEPEFPGGIGGEIGDGFENDIVPTPVGCVKCTTEELPEDGVRFRKCMGIKYATATRFENPIPIPIPRSITCDSTINLDDPPACFQTNNDFANLSGGISEDCLYLNVFVPLDCGDGPLPVVIYIHGGMFEMGSAPKYPSNLLKKGVIVVTINYRLSAFGFLSTGTCDCPGNAGLKDCLVALQWVKVNVAFFGGNPNDITLFGLSAGAAIASYFQLNPQACDLFKEIILESGEFNAPWASHTQSKAIERAVKLGSLVGCTNPATLCSCLKSVSADVLLEKTKEVLSIADLINFDIIAFLPTKENPTCPNTFMTQNPIDLLLKGLVCPNKPHLIGLAQEEACTFRKMIEKNKNILLPLTALAYKLAPQCLSETTNVLCIGYLTKEIAAHFANKDLVFNEENIQPLISIVQFVLPTIIYAKLMEKSGCKIYLFEFAYVGPCSVSKLMNPEGQLSCHGEMYPYIFPSEQSRLCNKFQPNPQDVIVTDILTSVYASFIRTGCPAPNGATGDFTWPTWTPEKQSYVEISASGPKVLCNLKNPEIIFWRKLLEKCYFNILNPLNPNCCSVCPKQLNP